eukprot:8052720-Pyramimonas_sp.AAC.1
MAHSAARPVSTCPRYEDAAGRADNSEAHASMRIRPLRVKRWPECNKQLWCQWKEYKDPPSIDVANGLNAF